MSDTLEHGIICTVKQEFGFIKCLERDEDLFFHYTELPINEQPKLGEWHSKSSLANTSIGLVVQGMEVEFLVATDSRSGKVSAVHLQPLPKGTVKFEVLNETASVTCLGVTRRETGRGCCRGTHR